MRDGYDLSERDGVTHVRAWGADEKELISKSLMGVAQAMRPGSVSGKTVRCRVRVAGAVFSETLKKFLDTAAFEGEMKNAIFSAVDFVHVSPEEIEGELIGSRVTHREEELSHIEIVSVDRNARGWEAESKLFFV